MEEPSRRRGRPSSRPTQQTKPRRKSPMISRVKSPSHKKSHSVGTSSLSSSDSPRLLPNHKRSGIYPSNDPKDHPGDVNVHNVSTKSEELYPSPRPNRIPRNVSRDLDMEHQPHKRDNRIKSRSPVRTGSHHSQQSYAKNLGALFADSTEVERDDHPARRVKKMPRAATDPTAGSFPDSFGLHAESVSSDRADVISPMQVSPFFVSHQPKRKVRRRSQESAQDMIQELIEQKKVAPPMSSRLRVQIDKPGLVASKSDPRLGQKKKRKIDGTFDQLRVSLTALRDRTVDLGPEDIEKEIALAVSATTGAPVQPRLHSKRESITDMTVSPVQRRNSLEMLSPKWDLEELLNQDFIPEATVPLIAAARDATGNASPQEFVSSVIESFTSSPRGPKRQRSRARSLSRGRKRSKSPNKKRNQSKSRSRSRSPSGASFSAVTVMSILKQLKKQYKMMETRMAQMDEERKANANERLMLQKLRKELDICQRENVVIRQELNSEWENLEKKKKDIDAERSVLEKDKEKLQWERLEVIDKQNEMQVIIEHETRLEVLKQIVDKEKEYIRKEWDKLENEKSSLMETREQISEDAHLMYRWKHALDREKEELKQAHEENDREVFRIEVLQERMDKCKDNNDQIKRNLTKLAKRVNEETLRVIGAFEDFVDSFSESFIDVAPRDSDIMLSRDQKEWMEQFVPSILNVRDFMDKEYKIQCRWLRNSDDLLNTDDVRIEYPPSGNRKQPASAWRSQLDRAGLKSHQSKDALVGILSKSERIRRWDNRTGKEENFDAKFRYELEQEEMLLDFDSDDDDFDDDDFEFDEKIGIEDNYDDDDDIDVDALVKSYEDLSDDDDDSDPESDDDDDDFVDRDDTTKHEFTSDYGDSSKDGSERSSFAGRKSLSAASSDLDIGDLSYDRFEENFGFQLSDDDDDDNDA